VPAPRWRRWSQVSPCTKRSKIRSWSPGAIPIPSSSTSTCTIAATPRARTVTLPPAGEYLNAFSSSWPTMMSVAIGSPLTSGRSAGMSATTWCLSDSGLNDTTWPRSSAARSNGPLVTGSASAPARAPSSSCSTRRPSDPGRSAMIRTAGPPAGVRQLLPPAGQRGREPLYHGDRRAQLMAGRREEQVLGLFQLLGRGDVAEVDHLLTAVAELGAQHVDPAPARQLVRAPLAGGGQREWRRRAHHLTGLRAGNQVRGRVPLLNVARLVEHRDAVGAAVDDGALMGTLLDHFFKRHGVGERHPRVPGEQLKQLELDMAKRPPAVER